jgi:hypothetical protein
MFVAQSTTSSFSAIVVILIWIFSRIRKPFEKRSYLGNTKEPYWGKRGHSVEYLNTDTILLFGRTRLSKGAVGEGALLPCKIRLSCQTLGPHCRTDLGERLEIWKMFWRSKFVLGDHFDVDKRDIACVWLGYEIRASVCLKSWKFLYGDFSCYCFWSMREQVLNV